MLSKRRKTLLLREEGLIKTGLVAEWKFQKTNQLLYSEQFDNAAWTKSDVTITANAVVAPDGATTADKLIETVATSIHAAYQQQTPAAGTYTLSVYAKAAERSWIRIRLGVAAAAYSKYFDLTNGAIGSSEGGEGADGSATIESAGNGWYRCSITYTAATALTIETIYIATADLTSNYAGDITKGLYLWGAQLNAGASIAPYEVTTDNQSVPDRSGNGLNLQLGATTGAEASDPVWSTGELLYTTDDYCLSPNITQIAMAGDWTAYLAGLFSGVSGTPISLAVSDTTNQHNSLVLGTNVLSINTRNGLTNNTSSTIVSSAVANTAVLLKSQSGILMLTRLDTNESITLANANPTGTTRLGIGCVAESPVSAIVSAMRSQYCALYSRAHSIEEQRRMYRYIKTLKAKEGITIL